MKKIILIISLLVLSNVAWAQKAPEGFCGLKWGSTKEELKKMAPGGHFTDFGDSISISPKGWMDRETEKSPWDKIGGAWIVHYDFNFYKNKFYWASIKFSKLDFDTLLRTISSKYRKPQNTKPLVLKINPNAKVGMEYTWVLEKKVEIMLSYNEMENIVENGTLMYIYLPIWNEINTVKDKDVNKAKDKL